MGPDKEQAFQLALMIQAGLPPIEAIAYFFPTVSDPVALKDLQHRWVTSKFFKEASLALQGKAWQDMTLEERIQHGLNRHYAQLAYFLFSSHYTEVGPADKAKLDIARSVLEAKQAGTAGKSDALSRFFEDINSGKLKLLPAAIPPPQKAH